MSKQLFATYEENNYNVSIYKFDEIELFEMEAKHKETGITHRAKAISSLGEATKLATSCIRVNSYRK